MEKVREILENIGIIMLEMEMCCKRMDCLFDDIHKGLGYGGLPKENR